MPRYLQAQSDGAASTVSAVVVLLPMLASPRNPDKLFISYCPPVVPLESLLQLICSYLVLGDLLNLEASS